MRHMNLAATVFLLGLSLGCVSCAAKAMRGTEGLSDQSCRAAMLRVQGAEFRDLFEASASTELVTTLGKVCIPMASNMEEARGDDASETFLIEANGFEAAVWVETKDTDVAVETWEVREYNSSSRSLASPMSLVTEPKEGLFELGPGRYRIALRYRPGRCRKARERSFCVVLSSEFTLLENSQFTIER